MGGAGKSEKQLPWKKSIFIFNIETKKNFSIFSFSSFFLIEHLKHINAAWKIPAFYIFEEI